MTSERPGINPSAKPSGTGCVECLATGGWWLHLRRCAECGHIGCCDNSPSQHASKHNAATGHPIVTSFEAGDLKKDITQLTAGTAKLSDESGVEVFYDLAITPAVRLIPSYQHIWNPFSAQVVTDQDHADVFLTRLTVAW